MNCLKGNDCLLCHMRTASRSGYLEVVWYVYYGVGTGIQLQIQCHNGESPNKTADRTDYLISPPSPSELQSLADKMDIHAKDFIRNKESVFKEFDLKQHIDDDTLLFQYMSENPKLIERPIVVKGERAVLGRPPEKVEDLLNS